MRENRSAPDQFPKTTAAGSREMTPPFTVTSSLGVFKATYKGTDNFAVALTESNGQSKDVLFNQIGSYNGSTVEQTDPGSLYWLKVIGDGSWTIGIS
jgi:hypothetical protein